MGETVAVGTRIWQRGVEKVLAMRQDWMEANPDTVDRLLRALDAAALWCDAPANQLDLAMLLARPHYVDQPAALILRALSGALMLSEDELPEQSDDFLLFHRTAANFPWRSQALWIYAQFRRWNMIGASAAAQHAAAGVFRPDIYRRALGGGGTLLPPLDMKVEGGMPALLSTEAVRGTLLLGPDSFFDGLRFDPERIDDYLANFRVPA